MYRSLRYAIFQQDQVLRPPYLLHRGDWQEPQTRLTGRRTSEGTRRIEQDICFITQHIDHKVQFIEFVNLQKS